MTADGFLRTGDLARVDEDGFVRIVDRKKDMIIVSGFNVYPNEIEDVVAMCAGVLESGVVGVPDSKSGEAVKLVVVKKETALTANELIAHCRNHLTGYKIPRHVEFRSELPKSSIGKVLRRALRDGVAQLGREDVASNSQVSALLKDAAEPTRGVPTDQPPVTLM